MPDVTPSLPSGQGRRWGARPKTRYLAGPDTEAQTVLVGLIPQRNQVCGVRARHRHAVEQLMGRKIRRPGVDHLHTRVEEQRKQIRRVP